MAAKNEGIDTKAQTDRGRPIVNDGYQSSCDVCGASTSSADTRANVAWLEKHKEDQHSKKS